MPSVSTNGQLPDVLTEGLGSSDFSEYCIQARTREQLFTILTGSVGKLNYVKQLLF